jgi:xylose isomerase
VSKIFCKKVNRSFFQSEVALDLAREARRNDLFCMEYGKLVLLYFALSSVGLARIGDTLEECKARYGEVSSTGTHPPYQFSPIRDERPWFTFEAEVEGAPVRIQAVFENGRVV